MSGRKGGKRHNKSNKNEDDGGSKGKSSAKQQKSDGGDQARQRLLQQNDLKNNGVEDQVSNLELDNFNENRQTESSSGTLSTQINWGDSSNAMKDAP